MTHILVAYGTTNGHTAKIAAAVAAKLGLLGAQVDVRTGEDALTEHLHPAEYDGVVVAGSLHNGAFQRPLVHWVGVHHRELNERPTLFLPVCLAVLQTDPASKAELAASVERFLTHHGWRPTLVKPVAGALVYTKYGWFTRWIMKRISAKAGRDTDTSRDYVYTDWKALDRIVESFYCQVAPAPPIPAGPLATAAR